MALNQLDDIKVNGFVLVRFATKKTLKYYIGQVTEIHPQDDEYIVSFLRYQHKKFVFPLVPDISTIMKSDIEMRLPEPTNTGGTARMNNSFVFPIDLNNYNLS